MSYKPQWKAIDPGEHIYALRHKNGLSDSAPVGIMSSFCEAGINIKRAGAEDIVHAIATTDAVDLDNEVVLPSGMESKSYMDRNKSIFVDHCYDEMHCVGRLRYLNPWPSKGSLKGWAFGAALMAEDKNEYAKWVRGMIEIGGCGVSIGFERLDGGALTIEEKSLYPKAQSIVRKWRLLEISFTAMPCNVECQTLTGVADAGKAAQVRELMTKSQAPASVLKAFGLDEKPRRRVVVWTG